MGPRVVHIVSYRPSDLHNKTLSKKIKIKSQRSPVIAEKELWTCEQLSGETGSGETMDGLVVGVKDG